MATTQPGTAALARLGWLTIRHQRGTPWPIATDWSVVLSYSVHTVHQISRCYARYSYYRLQQSADTETVAPSAARVETGAEVGSSSSEAEEQLQLASSPGAQLSSARGAGWPGRQLGRLTSWLTSSQTSGGKRRYLLYRSTEKVFTVQIPAL